MKRIYLSLIVLWLCLPIHSQSSNSLLPLESFAFSQRGQTVNARDENIGLLDNNSLVEGILRSYLEEGLDPDLYDEDVLRLLMIKHELFSPPVGEEPYHIRLSIIREDDKSIESRFLLRGDDYKEKGTIYLTRGEDKWLLSDIERKD